MKSAFLRLLISTALAACLAMTAAAGAEMYRWVDEHGVVNISDTVPEKYKRTAQRIESGEYEPTAAEKQQAAARLQALAASAAIGASAASAAAGPARLSRAAAVASAADGDDCAILQRRYREAQDCFATPVRTVNGAVNGAMLPQCPRVVDPSPRCGPPKIEPKPPERQP